MGSMEAAMHLRERRAARPGLFASSLSMLAATAIVGCADAPTGAQPATAVEGRAAAEPKPVDRVQAIQSARTDASMRYRELWVADVGAQRVGLFWIVELRSPTGSGVRYAISSQDGSIRERNTFQ